MKRVPSILVSFTFALLVAACGGTATDSVVTSPLERSDATTTAPAAPSTAPSTVAETTTTSSVPTAAASLEDVRRAVVRIVGTGTFADPFGGVQANVAGSGSGFVIDPSGLAVTNNHVVTGAALLEVYVGDDTTPRNARVVGVSECSDLAVIQIDGTEFDYLDWYDGPIVAGMEIFAAGFPLGDAEYTVLDGIIAKANAAGDTSWASIDAVVEHSADTLPGNSGGPIVTTDGKVVAVNYAGNDLGQSFAIGLDAARPTVETLVTGVDLDAVGINGEAIFDGVDNGVWVYSVKSGSPADVAGVQAGDLITTMESVTLGADGTMAAYCDILRSHLPTDVLGIEVYRASTDELLEGQLNGRALEVTVSFETQFDEIVTDDTAGSAYSGYQTVTDDSGLIEVSVPVEWIDVDGRQWRSDLTGTPDELIGPAVSASTNIQLFHDTWGTPGVFIGASALIPTTVAETIDTFWFGESCTYDGQYPYDDGLYTGLYDVYTNCGDAGSVFFQAIVEPADQTWIASIQIVAVTDADLMAADEIFASFLVRDLAG